MDAEVISRLKHICVVKQKEIDRLNKQLAHLLREDEKRVFRQAEVFQQFKKRTARVHNALDGKLLDIIDSYEQQLAQLRSQLHESRQDSAAVQAELHDKEEVYKTHNYKAILQSFKKQILEKDNKIRNLQERLNSVTLELQGRPKQRELRESQNRVKELEQALEAERITSQENIRVVNSDPVLVHQPADSIDQEDGQIHEKEQVASQETLPETDTETIDTKDLELVENDPIITCESSQILDSGPITDQSDEINQQYINEIMAILDVHQQEDVVEEVRRCKDVNEEMRAYYEFACDVSDVVRTEVGKELPLDKVLGVIKDWCKNTSNSNSNECSNTSLNMDFKRIIDHTLMLFEIKEVKGLYPHMNKVHNKLEEMKNFMTTLRYYLGLPEEAKYQHILESVDVLKKFSYDEIGAILQTDDLTMIAQKLDEHDNFLPKLRSIMDKLLAILNVKEMEDIIPAVEASLTKQK